MKAPNHGRLVKASDAFLRVTGRLIYTPAESDGFCLGLAIREYGGPTTPLLIGDRIEIIP